MFTADIRRVFTTALQVINFRLDKFQTVDDSNRCSIYNSRPFGTQNGLEFVLLNSHLLVAF
jgi:hypothetical protein